MAVAFVVTDTQRDVPVRYVGLLPDLFKEGKGVVAQGRLDAGQMFMASEVLAKHDENYMPPEAADAIQRAQKGQSRLDATMVQQTTPKAQP
jgi:cytochrome c-type biogenesis protein CcmE